MYTIRSHHSSKRSLGQTRNETELVILLLFEQFRIQISYPFPFFRFAKNCNTAFKTLWKFSVKSFNKSLKGAGHSGWNHSRIDKINMAVTVDESCKIKYTCVTLFKIYFSYKIKPGVVICFTCSTLKLWGASFCGCDIPKDFNCQSLNPDERDIFGSCEIPTKLRKLENNRKIRQGSPPA